MGKVISFLTSEIAGGIGLLLLVVGGCIVALGNYLRDEDYVSIVFIPVYIVGGIMLATGILFVVSWIGGRNF